MTLTEAQASFRQSPNRATALAYMDAAIEEFEGSDDGTVGALEIAAGNLSLRMQEIRDWLMNERAL